MQKQCNDSDISIYSMQTKVRYSECGANRQAGLSGILDYLQDVCTFQAEDLEIGLAYMQQYQTAWILSSWQVDLMRYPEFGETIRITTWPYDFHGFLGYRNFKIEDEASNMIVRANSVWVFMDMAKNRPTRIASKAASAYQISQRLDMEYMERKVPDFDAEQVGEPIKIPRSFIDTNQHVNNAKYILLAEELLPPQLRTVRFRAEYKKPAVYGDVLYPFLAQYPDHWAVKLSSKDGTPYVMMEFYADDK